MCGAKTSPLKIGAREVTFSPGAIRQTQLELDTGTAGSVALVFQCLLLPSLWAPRPVDLTLRGGTDVPGAPSCDYVQNVKLEVLKKMGVRVDFRILKRGYMPAGGGIVRARVEPLDEALLMPLILQEDATEALGAWGVSHASVASGKKREAEKQKRVAERLLTDALHVPARIVTDCGDTNSPGSGLVLWAKTGDSVFGASALGKTKTHGEKVADEAVERLVRTYHAHASTDPWMGDQVLPYLALSQGPSMISVPRVTRHMKTSMWLIQQFLHVRFFCEVKDMRTVVHCNPLEA
jgi:RNA 3'-phosphate cyclase